MKKLLAILLLFTLAGCGETIRGGAITGKYTKVYHGILEDDITYYLQLKKGNNTGEVSVSKEAWDQAGEGMQWPFKVKK